MKYKLLFIDLLFVRNLYLIFHHKIQRQHNKNMIKKKSNTNIPQTIYPKALNPKHTLNLTTYFKPSILNINFKNNILKLKFKYKILNLIIFEI